MGWDEGVESASGPDRIRNRCVSCRFPPLASWCIIFYERLKGTTFCWCCGRAGGGVRPARGRGERGGRRIPEVFVGAMPSSTTSYEKRTPAGVPSLPGALSYRTGRTSRTARMTLGVYLGEIHLPACRSRRGRCTRLGVSGWGAVNSFTGIRFF